MLIYSYPALDNIVTRVRRNYGRVLVFLVIVGLTGSLLAFYHELDHWLNPELLTVQVRDAPRLNPFTLRERADALEPRARIDQAQVGVRHEPQHFAAAGVTLGLHPGAFSASV